MTREQLQLDYANKVLVILENRAYRYARISPGDAISLEEKENLQMLVEKAKLDVALAELALKEMDEREKASGYE